MQDNCSTAKPCTTLQHVNHQPTLIVCQPPLKIYEAVRSRRMQRGHPKPPAATQRAPSPTGGQYEV